MNKSFTIVSIIFMILAIIGLGLTIFLINRYNWITTSMHEVEATIISITRVNDDNHEVIIAYQYDGQLYTTRYNTYSSTMRVGNKVTIYVNPGNPSTYYNPTLFTHIVLPSIFTVVFGLIGFPMFFSLRKTRKLKTKIMATGRRHVATVTEVNANHRNVMTINNRRYFRTIITCKIVDDFTEIEKTFVSRKFWNQAENHINIGKARVDVWIDPQNPEEYFVDTETIFNDSSTTSFQ